MAIQPESAKMTASRAYGWYRESRDHFTPARKLAQKCGQFYDGEQWTRDELAELKERKQPPTTNNHIKPTVDLVVGTEERVRVDFKGVPRSGAHIQDATVVTHLLKHVMDQCDGEYEFSSAFTESVKSGWSILEIKKNKDPFKEPVYFEKIDRDHIHWDPYARKFHLDDAKYIIRIKWLDLEEAQALYPEYKEALRAALDEESTVAGFKQPYEPLDEDDRGSVFDWESESIHASDWIDKARKRVRLLEVWYKVPAKIWVVENIQTGEREEWVPTGPEALQILMSDQTRILRTTIRKVRLAMIAGPNVLEDKWSPYRHNEYPFVFFWAYRSDKDKTPYSLVKQMLSPQEQINKRSSKALHILNAAQVITTERDEKKLEKLRGEAARPDGVLSAPKDGNLTINRDTNLAKAQFEMYRDAINEINLVSGINQDLLGQKTNAQSGKAIEARQASGATVLGPLFDNYKRSRLRVGELVFALIKQYYTTPKIIQITDQVGKYQFVTINEQTVDEQMQPMIKNDVARAKVDVKIDEQAYQASVRQALLGQLMEMVGQLSGTLPMVALALLDLVASYSDVPERDEITRRIRAIQAMSGVVAPEEASTEMA